LTQKALDFKKRMEKVREIEEEMLDGAKKKADKVLEIAEEKAQKIETQRLEKMDVIQNRLLAREEKMDEKLEKLEQEKVKLTEKQKEMEAAILQQMNKLAEVAKLTKEEAKEQLFSNVEKEYQKDMVVFIEKLKTITKEEAEIEVKKALETGSAKKVFEQFIKSQGGNVEKIAIAPRKQNILSTKEGYISEIDSHVLGNLVKELGGGRNTKEDSIDYGVGFILNKKVGDKVQINESLLTVYYNKKDISIQDILSAFKINDEMQSKNKTIIDIV